MIQISTIDGAFTERPKTHWVEDEIQKHFFMFPNIIAHSKDHSWLRLNLCKFTNNKTQLYDNFFVYLQRIRENEAYSMSLDQILTDGILFKLIDWFGDFKNMSTCRGFYALSLGYHVQIYIFE